MNNRIYEAMVEQGMTAYELAKKAHIFLSFSHYFYNLTGRLRCAVAILLQIKKG